MSQIGAYALFGIVTVCSDEKSFRPLQVGARNALVKRCAEPREAIMGLQSLSLNMPAGGEAIGGSQLPKARPLSLGDCDCVLIAGFSSRKRVATE